MTNLANAGVLTSNRMKLSGVNLLGLLEDLRRRLVHSLIYLTAGFFVAYCFHEKIYGFVEEPIKRTLATHHQPLLLNYHNPIDGFNMYLRISFMAGCIIAAPLVLYQVWLFISPRLYKHEKRFVIPFMIATVTLFLAGVYSGYRWVLPGSLEVLFTSSKDFKPLIEINEYTGLFLTVILGLGATFELPIVIMFLALFGIVNASFLWKNLRYAILIIFIIAGILAPTTDVLTMCVFAMPMLVLYLVGIIATYLVQRGRREYA